MQVTDSMIDNLANLARLKFSDEEKSSVKADLEKMIAFVEKLNEVDTTGVEPVMHMSSSVNVLREDKIKGSISREKALLNAPEKDAQFFKVPKVIKNPNH